jgi:hypothetical protein
MNPTTDQLRTWTMELGRRDPRCLGIVSTNVEEGQGEYEVRSATTGRVSRLTFTFEGGRILTPVFSEATNAVLVNAVGVAPKPYDAPLKVLRAALQKENR